MVEIGDTNYQIVQLDTNALSNILKLKQSKLDSLLKVFPPSKYIFSYSPFTLLEISRNSFLLDRFCKVFSIVPSFILKGYEQLRNEEIENYYKGEEIEAILFSPFDIKRSSGLFPSEDDIRKLVTHKKLIEAFKPWEEDKQRILNGMLSLKSNFQPKNSKYSKKEISYFIRVSTFQQVLMHDKQFITKNSITDESIIVDNLPSFKMMSYTVFYKFYSDNKKPQLSDVFDILIGATIPYIDVIITEKHFYDSIQKIKRQDSFLDRLEVYKLNEF